MSQYQSPEDVTDPVIAIIKEKLTEGDGLSIKEFMEQHPDSFAVLINQVGNLVPEGFAYEDADKISSDRLQNEPLTDYLLRLRAIGSKYDTIQKWMEGDGESLAKLVSHLHDLE